MGQLKETHHIVNTRENIIKKDEKDK